MTINPLVELAQLQSELRSAVPPTVLDIRWSLADGADRAGFAAGHIPGAHFVDLETDLSDLPGERGRHPMPQASRFAGAMIASGVRDSIPVVCYDAGTGVSAARGWWLLRYFGHPNVRVLDGGYQAWRAAGYPTSDTETIVPRGPFTAVPGGLPTLDASEVLDFGSTDLLLDARDEERYLGLVEPVDPVAGHIPGAVSAPTTGNLADDGRFRSADDLRDRFDAVGARSHDRIGVYCGSGVTAAHQVLALEVAGYRAALYPGSWSEWVTDPARPTA